MIDSDMQTAEEATRHFTIFIEDAYRHREKATSLARHAWPGIA